MLGAHVFRRVINLITRDNLPRDWVDEPVPEAPYRKFELAIRRDKRIRHLFLDDEFSQTFCDMMTAFHLIDKQSGEVVPGGSDDFRAVVAHYRNQGENHLDFLGYKVKYPMRDGVDREVLSEFLRIGYSIDMITPHLREILSKIT